MLEIGVIVTDNFEHDTYPCPIIVDLESRGLENFRQECSMSKRHHGKKKLIWLAVSYIIASQISFTGNGVKGEEKAYGESLGI